MRLEPVLQHLFARPLERACRDVAAVGDIAVVLQQESGSGVASQHDISAILNSQPAFLVRISADDVVRHDKPRSEEHTSELQSLMRISYAVFCLKKKNNTKTA